MPTVAMKAPAGHTMHGQCPHCKTALVPHDTEDKHAATFGALHCPDCRCCFKANGKLREHSATCSVDASTDEAHEFTRTDD